MLGKRNMPAPSTPGLWLPRPSLQVAPLSPDRPEPALPRAAEGEGGAPDEPVKTPPDVDEDEPDWDKLEPATKKPKLATEDGAPGASEDSRKEEPPPPSLEESSALRQEETLPRLPI